MHKRFTKENERIQSLLLKFEDAQAIYEKKITEFNRSYLNSKLHKRFTKQKERIQLFLHKFEAEEESNK
jgi:hypothetical protein